MPIVLWKFTCNKKYRSVKLEARNGSNGTILWMNDAPVNYSIWFWQGLSASPWFPYPTLLLLFNNNLLMNNLDQMLHRQPLVEREHTFLATYSNSIKLLFFDATLFIQNPDTWLETTQPKRKNKPRNKLWLTLTTEDERVNNTHDCDRYNQHLYARLICLNFVLLEVVLVHTKGCLRWRPNLNSLSFHWI